MARKRKRSHKQVETTEGPRKRMRPDAGLGSSGLLPKDDTFIKHPLLSIYYPQVLTLRNYLLSQLPLSSKSRRRRIASAGTHYRASADVGASEDSTQRIENDGALAKLLNATLVGQLPKQWPNRDDSRLKELVTFSQKVTSTVGSSADGGICSQTEACTHFSGIALYSCVFKRMPYEGAQLRCSRALRRLMFSDQCRISPGSPN